MRLSILLYSILFFSFAAAGQQPSSVTTPQQPLQRVEIVQAEFMRSLVLDTISIERMIGDVILKHNNIIMSCDSVYRFPNEKFEAYGNVKVVNGTTEIKGDIMVYDGVNNLAQVRGAIVYLTDGASTLRTTTIDYNSKDEIGFFEHEGTIKDPQTLLESKQGYYYSKIKDFIFIGSVQLKSENYTLLSDSMKYNTNTKISHFYSRTHIWAKNSYLYCNKGWYNSMEEKMFFQKSSYLMSDKQEVWADSIYYDGRTKQGNLYRNIQVLDTVQNTIAFGDYADFNMQTQNFEITIDPSIVFYSKNKTEDTLYMRADRLKSIVLPLPNGQIRTDSVSGKVDSTYRQVFGLKNVRIFRNDFQASCDSLYFSTLDSIWKMHHTPIIWNGEKMQLTSDTIKFFMVNEKMDRVEFQNSAMIIMPESDTSIYYNQIKGKNMTGHFKNNELEHLDILSNIQSAFFSTDEQAVSFHEAGNMTISFKNKKVRKIGYYIKPVAKAVPLFQAEEAQLKLKGFEWHKDKRPKSKDDILKRTIVPSKRIQINTIEQPTFPITKRIDVLEEAALKQKK